jgi:hypothetical protein
MPRCSSVIDGIAIEVRDWLFERSVRTERRVPGGYLNRWLIREVAYETRIASEVLYDGLNNVFYCHRQTFMRLKRVAK